MKIWVDAQLPSTLADLLAANFRLDIAALRDFGLRDAQDIEILNVVIYQQVAPMEIFLFAMEVLNGTTLAAIAETENPEGSRMVDDIDGLLADI